jgi:hypothetical protein
MESLRPDGSATGDSHRPQNDFAGFNDLRVVDWAR